MSDEQKQTAEQPAPAGKWWQTLIVSVANVGVSILLFHYLGPTAGGAAAAIGTGIAYRAQGPVKR